MSFRFDSISSGTVTYIVDGISITKTISRQTWKTNALAASYIGAAIGTYSGSGCGSIAGYREEPAIITVTQTASPLSIAAAYTDGGSCSYSGAYTQAGRMGSFNGALACSSGTTGTATAFEIEGSISAFTARATASLGGGVCNWSGRIGGLRRGS
jgi:hypothetical protein